MKSLEYGARLIIVVFALHSTSQSWAGEIRGQVTTAGGISASSVVVYLDAIPGKNFDAPAKHAVVDQKHLTFVPHVLVVIKGTTVDFLNSDATSHNVFWPAIGGNKKLKNNLGTWPQGQVKSFKFNDPGVVPLLCNVHPEMSGYVVVVTNPYFSLLGPDGSFVINNIPPGAYSLKTWSEEGKPITQAINVGDGTTTVTLAIRR